jgi:hypothetical protein
MLKMFQHAMLGETNTKSFAVMCQWRNNIGTYNWCFVLFWDVSKTNYRFDYAKSGRNFNSNKQN